MTSIAEPRFACDAMLGGLARWLRAAGYEAYWQQGIADQELVRLCHREGRTLLSCDTKLFLCRVLRDKLLPALLVPLRRTPREQLAHVLTTFKLPLRPARCMSCGGSLAEVPKATLRDRVPARMSMGASKRFSRDPGDGQTRQSKLAQLELRRSSTLNAAVGAGWTSDNRRMIRHVKPVVRGVSTCPIFPCFPPRLPCTSNR